VKLDKGAVLACFAPIPIDDKFRRELCAQFVETYAVGAQRGFCDTPGGMEFRRISAQWLDAGMPLNMIRFIIERVAMRPTKEV
jgi:hypothetical protein